MKYVCRYLSKNKIEDLQKIIHYCELEILKLKDELNKIISKHTGQTFKKVNADSDRDYWMKADEAHKYGMVDEVLNK